MAAYYNEIDPYAAQWLRNLIAAGLIAPGVVDERSIEDVHPSELRGFTQCHFFAGIGVWSLALRRAGWPDDRPVWTGSCPCQPFSAAGAGSGFEDPRHLWPSFLWLIEECRPPIIFGEQVAGKPVGPWVDLVHADLETVGYAFGAVPFPSAGVGAPHIRDRLFWVGYADNPGLERHPRHGRAKGRRRPARSVASASVPLRLANADGQPCEQGGQVDRGRDPRGNAQPRAGLGGGGLPDRLADADGGNAGAEREQRGGQHGQQPQDGRGRDLVVGSDRAPGVRPGPVNGFWRDADWLSCRDAKWRPVRPGTFPLAYGAPARMGRLRAYGNAINAEQAKEFITAFLEIHPEVLHAQP